MKKLLLMLTTITLSFTLSGCYLLEDDSVTDLSEEYCRENPTSEICQGETVGELENSTVENVFKMVMTDYQNANNDTFCEDYFSITNPDLLDTCRNKQDSLVPENLSDFTIESIISTSSLSTMQTYDITIVDKETTETYLFSIGLVMVEGIMYITGWSFDKQEMTADDSVTDGVAEAFLEQMVHTFLDESIFSSDYCSKYAYSENYNACIIDRNNYIANNATIYANADHGKEADGFTNYYVSFTINDPVNDIEETITLRVHLAYDDNGNIVLTHDPNEEPALDITDEEAYQFITDMINDLADSTQSNDTVCEHYFIPENYNRCINERLFIFEQDVSVTVSDLVMDENHYNLTVSYTYPDNTIEDMTFNFVILSNPSGGYLLQFFDDMNDTVSTDDASAYLTTLLDDFVDTQITAETFCQTHFDIANTANCFLDKSQFTNMALSYHLDDFVYEYGNTYQVTVTFSDELGNDYNYIFYLDFYYNDVDQIRVDYWIEDIITFDDALAQIYVFIETFNDFNVTDDYVCSTYLDPSDYDTCLSERAFAEENNLALNFVSLDQLPIDYQLSFEYIDNDYETQDFYETYLRFYLSDTGFMMMDWYDTARFNYLLGEDAIPYITQLFYEFNDITLSDDIFCEQYNQIFKDCHTLRQNYHENGYYYNIITPLTEQTPGHFVDLDIMQDSTVFNSTQFYIEVIQNEDNSIEYHGYQVWDDSATVTLQDAETLITNFINDYTNAEVTLDDLFTTYFGWYNPWELESYRQDILDLVANGATFNITDVTIADSADDFSPFIATMNIIYPDNTTVTFDIPFYVINQPEGFTTLELAYEYQPITDQEFTLLVNQFIGDFTDTSIDNSVFCNLYFEDYMQDQCDAFRDDIMTQNFTLTIDQIVTSDFDHSVTINFIDSNDIVQYKLTFFVYYHYDLLGNIHAKFNLDETIDDATIQLTETVLTDYLETLDFSSTSSIDSICQTYFIDSSNCDIILNNHIGKSIAQTEVYEIYTHNDFYDIYAYATVKITFDDGAFIVHDYKFYPNQDTTSNQTYLLEIIYEYIGLPSDATLVDQATTQTVLTQFTTDYVDASISDETFADMYFNGNFMGNDIIEFRQQDITDGVSVTLSSLSSNADELGNQIFVATFIFDDGVESITREVGIEVYYSSALDQHIIIFLD
ncbi:MAG: hypothetical protein K9L26_01095 [Candidatus Izimaplasma sp.]|nr:hypothetical protein [Candidatus Izimaplasma bacterium]